MDDHLALLVGRVSLAFGQLDQFLYTGAYRLEMEQARCLRMRGVLFPDFEAPPRAFSGRCKRLMRLVGEVSNQDASFKKRAEQLRSKVATLTRSRAHLTHGYLSVYEGKIRVSDYREDEEYSATFKRLLDKRASRGAFVNLWKRHHEISYTAEQVGQLATDIDQLRVSIEALVEEAVGQSRTQRIELVNELRRAGRSPDGLPLRHQQAPSQTGE